MSTYEPVWLVSTVPDVGTLRVPDPSTLSVHVAQSSVYVDPDIMLMTPDPLRVITGGVVSMLDTLTFTDPVFPAISWKRNTPVPLDTKVMVVRPELLVMVMGSDSHVRVTRTPVLVGAVVEYTTEAVGGIMSGIRVTPLSASDPILDDVTGVPPLSVFEMSRVSWVDLIQ